MTNIKMPSNYKQLSEEEFEYDGGLKIDKEHINKILGITVACVTAAAGLYMTFNAVSTAVCSLKAVSAVSRMTTEQLIDYSFEAGVGLGL